MDTGVATTGLERVSLSSMFSSRFFFFFFRFATRPRVCVEDRGPRRPDGRWFNVECCLLQWPGAGQVLYSWPQRQRHSLSPVVRIVWVYVPCFPGLRSSLVSVLLPMLPDSLSFSLFLSSFPPLPWLQFRFLACVFRLFSFFLLLSLLFITSFFLSRGGLTCRDLGAFGRKSSGTPTPGGRTLFVFPPLYDGR